MFTTKITLSLRHIIGKHILFAMLVIVLAKSYKMFLLHRHCCSNIRENVIENTKEIKIKEFKIFYWASIKPWSNNTYNLMESAAILRNSSLYSSDNKESKNKSTTISSSIFVNFTLKCAKTISIRSLKILQLE